MQQEATPNTNQCTVEFNNICTTKDVKRQKEREEELTKRQYK